MNLSSHISFFNTKSRYPRQVVSANWFERMQALEEDVNLFCWKRSIDKQIVDYLEKCVHKGSGINQFLYYNGGTSCEYE